MISSPIRETLYRFTVNGPVGTLICLTQQERLIGLAFPENMRILERLSRGALVHDTAIAELRTSLQDELDRYTERHANHSTVPMELRGSALQKKVWDAVAQIPYGETRSYSQIAAALDINLHPRAVARAIAANPILILVPCHRVISQSGNLSGYSGGLENKRKLLAWESQHT